MALLQKGTSYSSQRNYTACQENHYIEKETQLAKY